jgi:hypothetical protein|tara:strand:- start:971 stop:2179 length:1209 start_codon:yes stop_codon:yes gene_type:complete
MKLAIIKLDSINKTVSGITEAVKKANSIASDIGKKVREANVRLRERISNANKDYQRRLDSSRKKQREELIEALGIGGAMRRTGQVIKNTAKGFLGRIMEFVSVVLIGWAVMNIPKIIKGAQLLIGRLRKFFEVGEKIVKDLTEFLTNFGTELNQIFSNLLGFDFSQLQDRISSIMTKLQNDFRTLERGLIRDVNNLVNLSEEDIANMMGDGSSTDTDEIQQIDETIYDQGINKELYDKLPDKIKTGLRALVRKNQLEGKPPLDEIDLEDLRNADSVDDFEQVLKDNRFQIIEVNGKEVYVPPEFVDTKNIEEEVKDFFSNDDNNNKEDIDKNENKKISFNNIKNDRKFELDKKSKDIYIPFNEVYNNNSIALNQNKEGSLQLNSDNDNGYNSLDNQFIQALT